MWYAKETTSKSVKFLTHTNAQTEREKDVIESISFNYHDYDSWMEKKKDDDDNKDAATAALFHYNRKEQNKNLNTIRKQKKKIPWINVHERTTFLHNLHMVQNDSLVVFVVVDWDLYHGIVIISDVDLLLMSLLFCWFCSKFLWIKMNIFERKTKDEILNKIIHRKYYWRIWMLLENKNCQSNYWLNRINN